MSMEKMFTNRRYHDVYNAVKRAIKECGFRIDSEDEKTGKVKVSTGFSIKSWGENIDIEITSISDLKHKVRVSSSAKAQLFDWGKSSENETLIMKELKKILW